MFLCRPCKEGLGVEGLVRSWGRCEMCDGPSTYCFDIPASRFPKAAVDIDRLIEELFGLARECRLGTATYEAGQPVCQELDRAIGAVPADVLPMLVRHLVIMVDEISHSYQEARTRR